MSLINNKYPNLQGHILSSSLQYMRLSVYIAYIHLPIKCSRQIIILYAYLGARVYVSAPGVSVIDELMYTDKDVYIGIYIWVYTCYMTPVITLY